MLKSENEYKAGAMRILINGLIEYKYWMLDGEDLNTTFFNFLIDALKKENVNIDLLNDVNYIDGLIVGFQTAERYLED